MKLLEERIISDGVIKEGGIVKVDSFLNHQMDISLINEIGKEFYRLFGNDGITKILTVEASGIGIACIAAQYFNVPVVFAKKSESKNLDGDVYTSKVVSYTKGKEYDIRVSKKYISANDRVLVIDDFLAKGKAVFGLCDILDCCPKADGIGLALRTLCPDVIVFDEICDVCEAQNLVSAMNSGVSFVFSTHADSFETAAKRAAFQLLLKNGALDLSVVLGVGEKRGKIVVLKEIKYGADKYEAICIDTDSLHKFVSWDI